jgi:hypothetical protein
LIYGRESDDVVLSHMDDYAATGEVGDNFVFAILSLGHRRGIQARKQEKNRGEPSKGECTMPIHRTSIVRRLKTR